MHGHGGGGGDRVLRLIAVERALRAIVLLAAGLVLVTHAHESWGTDATSLARHLGLDTNGQGLRRLLTKISLLRPSQIAAFGLVAMSYGVLEGVEAYGLWRARPWAEYLTIIATSLLFIPEVWELSKSLTPLKLGGLLVNIVIVAYLVRRLLKRRRLLDRAAAGGPA